MSEKHNKHKNDGLIDKKDEANPVRIYSFPIEPLLPSVDLRQWMTPIEHQKDMQTCSANAFAGICEYLIKRSTNRPFTIHHTDISRLFIYYNGQRMSQKRRTVRDLGVEQRYIALGLRKFGVCDEEYWPYEERYLNKKPSNEAYRQAKQYTAVALCVSIDILAIETCLHNQIPVPIDIILDGATEQSIKANDGYLVMHDLNDRFIDKNDLHTVVIVGYDRRTRHFIVRNSWGADWGYQGYFYMPYHFLSNRRRVNYNDCLWTIMNIIPRPEKLPSIRQLVLFHHKQNNHHHH